MRRVCLLAALLLGWAGTARAAPFHLVLQLSDVRQAQFAGYYVAAARGLYAAAGLDVEIRPGPAHGDSDVPHAGADVWSAWLPQALAARAGGLDLVNFAQIFPHSALELVCRTDVRSPYDMKGRVIGVWQDGTQVAFLAWMTRIGFQIPRDLHMLPIPIAGDAAIAPLLDRDAACITALSYDQYWRLVAAGLPPEQLRPFHFGDVGMAILQDGLYAQRSWIDDPARSDALVRFLRASEGGWKWAVAHQPQAVAIVLDDGHTHDAAQVLAQTRMLSTVARLTESGLHRAGYLEPAAYDRTVQMLLAATPPAPVDAAPQQGWTHEIWRRAGIAPPVPAH